MISERKVDEKSYKANADDWARKKKEQGKVLADKLRGKSECNAQRLRPGNRKQGKERDRTGESRR